MTASDRFSVETVDDTAIVVLPPEVSVADVASVTAVLRSAAAQSDTVIVDLTSVRLIDAATARALRAAQRRCVRAGIRFAAPGAENQPLRVLEIFGLAKEFDAYLTRDEALDVTRRPRVVPRSIDRRVHEILAEVHTDGTPDGARNALRRKAIETALPMARTMARRYQQRGELLDDLEQVASLGLVKAVNRYDPARGSGFLAFAVPTILGELRRHFRDHSWSVRPPRALQELQSEAISAWSDLSQQLGHSPDTTELAEYLAMDDNAVREAIRSSGAYRTSSLDAGISDSSERTLYDTIGRDDEQYEVAELRITVEPLIASLPDRCREILTLRMTTELTQAEIGEKVGLSQMGVSRCLARTLETLRTALGAPMPQRPHFQRKSHAKEPKP